ncbi:hypothetical protein T11_7852 [Trichinella zimbabwensis]|uniref:Uncharacterized protein n=1 Tax=Trichinella zimbabwensis TaxID=268475 RepID=A0A0V1HW72_9BILA|nr:hypothetical protein T11_7852 [Trichinella zimbabwensis]
MGHAVLPLFYGKVKPRTTVFLKQRIVSLQLPKFAMSVEYSVSQEISTKPLSKKFAQPPSNAAFQH